LLPLPDSASLPAPIYEKQDANNCGPGTLTMYLRSYGWKGDQNVIAKVIKPDPNDRNVNVDELVYFVRTQVGWLNAGFRVGGDIDLLKRFIANGMPIMIEETSLMDKQYWPGDDLWAGHYLLLTAYDDAKQQFTSQDSWLGPNLLVDYKVLDGHWQSFNRAYIMVYQPGQEELVQAILRENWDPTVNRQNALNKSESETISDPKNAFAWFNLGTNLLYFERYREAAAAYDQARQIGLPQRMLRYQFGPFIAYFRTNRIDDLKALTDFALKITANSEENLLWDGWALYVKGKKVDAVAQFKAALKVNPFYADAQYALNYVGAN
jgi:tetratricopeptide (TPR) repeat protein